MRPLGEPSPAPAAAAGGGLGLGLDGEIQTQAQVAQQSREERKKIPLPQILDIAENSVSLLEDLLGSLTGDDPTAVKDDVITQLADACKRASRPIREAIETSTDEEVVTRALQVYERIAKQMDKYDSLLAVYYSAREKMIAEAWAYSPSGSWRYLKPIASVSARTFASSPTRKCQPFFALSRVYWLR